MSTSVSSVKRFDGLITWPRCVVRVSHDFWSRPDGCNGTDILVEWEFWSTPGCVGGSGPTELKNKSPDDILGADVCDSLKIFIEKRFLLYCLPFSKIIV